VRVPVIEEQELEPRQPFPWMVTGLVVANCLLWLVQLRESDAFTNALAAVPYELTHDTDLVDPQWVSARGEFVSIDHAPGPHPIYLTLISSMFLHGSWAHLLGNMLYLAVFGAPIERRTGPFRFFAFYGLCGLLAGVAHVVSTPQSMVPVVGASGAISGILGAYVLTFPLSEVPIIIRLLTMTPKMPAIVVFGFWLFLQYIGYLTGEAGDAGGVAFMAHIGGFLAGLILAAFLIPNAPPPKPRRHGWIIR
jgi:membrane associated rhomboid family serine protease